MHFYFLLGRAAVRSSDYAFSKFKHLHRVLLVHGHWYYYRAGNLVQYFFYKNIACFTSQLYFAFFNSFSTQTLFDEMNLTMYNIIYTSIPVFLFGLFEKNYGDKTLLANPELYKSIRKNALLSPKVSLMWFFDAIWSSLVSFFAFYILFINNSNEALHDNLGMLSFGFSIYQCVVVVVSFRLLTHSRNWNVLLLLSIFLSLVVLLGFNLAYHSIVAPLNSPNAMYQIIFHVLSSPSVWLATLLCTGLSLLPYIITEYVSNVIQSSSLLRKKRDQIVPHETNGGKVDNPNIITMSEMVDDTHKTNGISIIGSATRERDNNCANNNKDNNKHELDNDDLLQSNMSTHNPEYAFINNGYLADESEDTRL